MSYLATNLTNKKLSIADIPNVGVIYIDPNATLDLELYATRNQILDSTHLKLHIAESRISIVASPSPDERIYVDAIINPSTLDPYGNLHVALPSSGYDRFGRLRTSTPQLVFESHLVYDSQTDSWGEFLSSGSTGSYNSLESSYLLTIDSLTDSYATRQTHRYFTYFPGMGYLMMFTGVLGTPKPNLASRIGYFDDNDGIFFEGYNGNLAITLRTSTSGTKTETRVFQDSWNLDTMDGYGPSKIILDPSKTQIFALDFSWLGVGGVRCSLIIGQQIINVHEFILTNVIDKVYMKTPNLPIRYEIRNLGATGSSSSLKQICCSIIKEGEGDLVARSRSVNNGSTTRDIDAVQFTSILAIRLRDNYLRSSFKLDSYSVFFTTTADVLIEIVLNPTLTNPTFNPFNSAMEYDVVASAIAGGSVIHSEYLRGAQTRTNLTNLVNTKEIFGSRANGTKDIIAIRVKTLSGNSKCAAVLNFSETH